MLPFDSQLPAGSSYSYDTMSDTGGHFVRLCALHSHSLTSPASYQLLRIRNRRQCYCGFSAHPRVCYWTKTSSADNGSDFIGYSFNSQPGNAGDVNGLGYPASCLGNLTSEDSGSPQAQPATNWVRVSPSVCSSMTSLTLLDLLQ